MKLIEELVLRKKVIFDTRLIAHHLRREMITLEEVEKHLKELPDTIDKAVKGGK